MKQLDEKQVVLITHKGVGKGLYETLGYFVADLSSFHYFEIGENETLDHVEAQINAIIDQKHTYFLATDFGLSSSTQIAVHVSKGKENVHLLTGVNLMMLFTLLSTKMDTDIESYIEYVLTTAKQDIRYWNVS